MLFRSLATSSAALTVNPWVMKNLPYDPDKDLSSLFGIGRTPSLISVPASLPVKNVQELVALAKQKPDGLAYGSAGVGSATHLQTEIFLREIGNVKALHVPYKGIADINRGLLGNEIQFGLTAVQLTIGAVKAGQVKAIGLIGERRDKLFPDVPTLREQGFPQSSGSIIWFGLALPAKTPPALVARMACEIGRAHV